MDFNFFWIQSNATQECVTATGPSQPLTMRPFDQYATRQQWLLDPPFGLSDVVFHNRATTEVADAQEHGGEWGQHSPVQTHPFNDGPNQHWILQSDAIVSSGPPGQDPPLVWDIPNSEMGRDLQLHTVLGQPNQQWTQLNPIQITGCVRIISTGGRLPLDVVKASFEDGAEVQQYFDQGPLAFNQWWLVTDTDAPIDNNVLTQNVVNDVIVNIMSVSSGLFLQVPKTVNSSITQAPVSLGMKDGSGEQLWRLVPENNGHMRIRPWILPENFSLDVENAPVEEPSLVQIFGDNDGLNQLWDFEDQFHQHRAQGLRARRRPAASPVG